MEGNLLGRCLRVLVSVGLIRNDLRLKPVLILGPEAPQPCAHQFLPQVLQQAPKRVLFACLECCLQMMSRLHVTTLTPCRVIHQEASKKARATFTASEAGENLPGILLCAGKKML